MLDNEDMVDEAKDNTGENNECSEEEMEYLAKLWEMKIVLDKL